LTARLGGDEFTLLLENLHSASEAIEIAERILHELAQPVALTQSVAYIGGSIGIVYSEAGDARADILLRDADTAMYHAKTNGKNAFALFEPSMNDRVVERMEIETGLRQALAQNELRVYYQPLLDLTNGKLTGVEALVRWQHPERGLIPPGQFIPIAEETGLILPLGYWVLEEACGQIAQWGRQRPEIAALTLNVNLSGKQLQQEDVVERIAEILRRTELPPDQLKLEITESVLLEDVVGITQKLGAIKALGVKLAIDDFGTGYSSLSALQEFPVDTVKIDRSFVNRLAEEDGNAIISAIISLSKAMRLDVTGEGIETAEQVALLQELGCDVGQGFFFDRPMPGEAMQARFKTGDANAEPETAERTEQELRALWSRNANDQRKAA
jgi:predicted signal transduction protein with EAL and GGDEF domain